MSIPRSPKKTVDDTKTVTNGLDSARLVVMEPFSWIDLPKAVDLKKQVNNDGVSSGVKRVHRVHWLYFEKV
ncbi:hypothetical protein [Pseudomonas sp. PB3P13]